MDSTERYTKTHAHIPATAVDIDERDVHNIHLTQQISSISFVYIYMYGMYNFIQQKFYLLFEQSFVAGTVRKLQTNSA